MKEALKAKLEKFKKTYADIAAKYHEALFEAIKDMLTNTFSVPKGKGINIREILSDNHFDILGKYETPKVYPANYLLFKFGLDESGKLSVDGYDNGDSDCEWTFSEYDFSVSELEEILSLLESLEEEIQDGTLVMDEDFRVEEA